MKTARYLDISVELREGQIKVLSVAAGRFPHGPTLIPRYRGRFEVRLFTRELLRDIVRFDLPLTGAAENLDSARDTRLGDRLGLGLAKGVTTKGKVRVPFDDEITNATLDDSLTRRRVTIDLSKTRAPRPEPGRLLQVPGRPTDRLEKRAPSVAK